MWGSGPSGPVPPASHGLRVGLGVSVVAPPPAHEVSVPGLQYFHLGLMGGPSTPLPMMRVFGSWPMFLVYTPPQSGGVFSSSCSLPPQLLSSVRAFVTYSPFGKSSGSSAPRLSLHEGSARWWLVTSLLWSCGRHRRAGRACLLVSLLAPPRLSDPSPNFPNLFQQFPHVVGKSTYIYIYIFIYIYMQVSSATLGKYLSTMRIYLSSLSPVRLHCWRRAW